MQIGSGYDVFAITKANSMSLAISKILVPTDFSKSADYAMEFAVDMAKKFGAEIHIIHVVPILSPDVTRPDLIHEVEENAVEHMKTFAPDIDPSIRVVRVMKHGSAYQEICQYAEAQKNDMIVMGTHGNSYLHHLLLGSVVIRVASLANCPVVTVRHPSHRGS